MSNQPSTSPRYWIFKDPYRDLSRVHDAENAGVLPWIVDADTETKPGDVVYFWVEEDSSYFYTWGTIVSERAPMIASPPEAKPSFEVQVKVRVPSSSSMPVMGREMLDEPALEPLWNLREIRKNFLEIDTNQATALNRLFRARDREAPPDPIELAKEAQHQEADGEEDQPTNTTLDQLNKQYRSRMTIVSDHILELAGQLANQRERNRDRITTSCLLFAATEVGRQPLQASLVEPTDFLFRWLQQSKLLKAPYDQLFSEFLNPSNPDRKQGVAILTMRSMRVFETALKIGEFVRSDPVSAQRRGIDHHDLVGALLFQMAKDERLGAVKRLGGTEVSRALRIDYFNNFLRQEPHLEDDIEKWRTVLIDLTLPDVTPARVAAERKASLPDIDADTPAGGADLLNIKHEVEGFARIIAARDVKTPLSIGLFGDWGSGKSTFMQRLQAEVDQIATAVRNKKDGEETSFLGNIVQIEFNAWHYAEANLWASLVSHVFENLSFTKERDQEMAAQKQTLFLNQLGVRLATQGAAEAEVLAKEVKYANAKVEVDAAKQAQSNARIELSELLKNGVWLIVKELVGGAPEAKAQIDEALALFRKSGLTEEELKRQIQASRTTLGRLGWYLREFWRDPRHWLYVFLILLATILLTYVAASLGSAEVWVRLAKFVAPFVPLLTGALTWLWSKRETVNAVLDKLETANKQLDRFYKSARDEYDRRLAKLNQELENNEREVNDANERLNQAKSDVTDTVSELSNMTPERLLQNFVQERASSNDYRRLLGVIALIRRDFNKLSDMMLKQGDQRLVLAVASMLSEHAKQKAQNPPPDGEAAEAPADETETLAADGANQFLREKTADGRRELQNSDSEEIKAFLQQVGRFRIDRIVLYIDDLDRCPPRQVVHVLQAIHLLLAFKLFVVVVGVDARWVRQALRKYYPEMLDEDIEEHAPDRDGERRLTRAATPRDYVEKIFQIPFWIKPMNADASKDLLRGLITDDQLVPEDIASERKVNGKVSQFEELDSAGSRAHTQEQESDLSADHTELADSERLSSGTGAGSVTSTTGSSGSGAGSQDMGTGVADAGKKSDETIAPAITLKPTNLLLAPKERETMVALSQIIGKTPRTVKRFVNIYRIIKAGLDDKQLEAFNGTHFSNPQYPAVLVLLAVAHGSPEVAPVFFRGLKTRHERTIANGETATGLVGFLRLMAEAPGLAEPLHENWKCLIEDLGKFNRVSKTNIMVPVLCEWLPVVVRYTFQLGRLSDEIGQPPDKSSEQTV